MSSRRHERVSDWLVERLAAGELPESQARHLRATLREQGEENRLDALAASNAEILAAFPPEQMLVEIRRRDEKARARHARPYRSRPILAVSMLATCAVGLAVFLIVRDHQGAVPNDTLALGEEHTIIKGPDRKPYLRIFRKAGPGSAPVPAGAPVRKGDTLQISYVAAGKPFGVIASVDARGTVNLHLPEIPGPAANLNRSGEHTLAHSYELDDSPGFERFVFVTSDASFGTDEVARFLTSGHALPPTLTAIELTLKKETP